MHNRISYPFISATGDSTLVKNAVDDMVVYVSLGTVLPLIVRVDVDNDVLCLNLYSYEDELVARAYAGNPVIEGVTGDACGFISWNTAGCIALKSTIVANDPQPWGTLYVDPYACIAHKPGSLSVVRVNGEDISGPIINISIPTDNKSLSIDDSGSIHIYRDYSDEALGISRIVFTIPGKDTVDYHDLNGHVVLSATAESDVRVVTSDVIDITEITNDNI